MLAQHQQCYLFRTDILPEISNTGKIYRCRFAAINSNKMESLTPNIYVDSVSSTLKYYQKLGFETIVTVPDADPEPVWAMVQNGPVNLMFESFKSIEGRLPEISRQPGGSLLLYIKVKDINELFERLKDEVEILHGLTTTFYGATEFSIKDLNNYVITFAENKTT
jgi:uncharacterized glyoxalase superfamily protein PhnB